MDPAAPKASAEDGAFYWSRNLSQIIFAQEAAVGHHVFMDEMRYATRIEITDALVCQSAQRSREHRLAEAGAGGIGGAVRLQEEASCRPGLEVFKCAGCELVLERCDLVPLFGKTYCRGQNGGAVQGAVLFQRVAECRSCAGDGSSCVATTTLATGDGVCGGMVGCPGRTVQSEGTVWFCKVDEHHGLSAQAGSGRFAYTQGKGGGYGGIDRVASGFKYFYSGSRSPYVRRRHHPSVGPLGARFVCGAVHVSGLCVGVLVCYSACWSVRNWASSRVLCTRLMRCTASWGVPRLWAQGPTPHRQEVPAGTRPATEGHTLDWRCTGICHSSPVPASSWARAVFLRRCGIGGRSDTGSSSQSWEPRPSIVRMSWSI